MAQAMGTSEDVGLRKFTVDDFHLMAENGIFAPDERLELVRGVVRTMSPKNRAHVIASNRTFEYFYEALRGRARVYKEDPLQLSGLDSEPEPDIMICSNPDLDTYGTPLTAPLMVIEISDSSLLYDLVPKALVYAQAGIPEYWVVNLVDNVLVVFRGPSDGGYALREDFGLDSTVRPQAWPDLEVEVARLFRSS